MALNLRYNEHIRISPVRLIDAENNQIGIISTDEAIKMAREANLDLVEVAPKERPVVCRIMDYGKWKYSQKKRHKKHHHEQQLKEVRIRPKTDDNDRRIKVNRAIRFLKKGDKVQFTMVFRGRERAHREIGVEILMRLAKDMGELIKLERPPSMDGRNMVMIVSPNKNYVEKPDSPEGEAAEPKKGTAGKPATVAEPTQPAESSTEPEPAPPAEPETTTDVPAEPESTSGAEPGDSPA